MGHSSGSNDYLQVFALSRTEVNIDPILQFMNVSKPAISIVTPSYNMLAYLKRCSASVRDQQVNYEHIVMDGGSKDGTQEWLKQHPDIISVSEKDKGMYHALNKAIDRTQAEIIGHLNCDEQYLPGTLQHVLQFFRENPTVDFIAGNFLVIDPAGQLVAFRKTFTPRWPYFFSNYLYTTTCVLFYRKKIFAKCRFDESYKSIADVIFLYNVMKAGFKGSHIKRYLSAFTYSGDNLSLHRVSGEEKIRFNKTLPLWFRILKPVFFLSFFAERVMNNTYNEKSPLSYSIFTADSLNKRKTITVSNPQFRLIFRPSVNAEG